MTLNEFMDGIHLCDEAKEVVSGEIFKPDLENMSKLFFSDFAGFVKRVSRRKKPYKQYLWYFCRFALLTHKEYKRRGISDRIFFDTFYDFTIWNDNCVYETGVCGLREVYWLKAHLYSEIFRLGRLQFKPVLSEKEINLDGEILPQGTRFFEVHIPAGAKLTQEDCEASYRQAKEFFKDRLFLTCYSWLLSPRIENFLDSGSNILKFKNRFKIIDFFPDSKSGERFVFRKILDSVQDYIADTPFKKRVKDYLLAGNRIGEAYGIFEYK